MAQCRKPNMKIIAIAMQKGGVGKSTLTRSLAVAATEAGLNVLALDMDTQQSTSQWKSRREAPLPLVRFTTEIDLPAELERARKAGCDLVVIDTPPARSTEAPAAVEYSDFVLVPCTADIEAFEQLPRTARLARTTGKPAAAILTMATPNSRSEVEIARKVFETVGLDIAPTALHRLKVHRDASRLGQTAQELEPNGKAAEEVRALAAWVFEQINLGTSASMQNGTSAHVHKRGAA